MVGRGTGGGVALYQGEKGKGWKMVWAFKHQGVKPKLHLNSSKHFPTFSNKPFKISVKLSKYPSIQVSKNLSIQVYMYPSIQVSKYPGIQVSKYPSI